MAKLAGASLQENDQSAVVTSDSVQRGAAVFYAKQGKLNVLQLFSTTKAIIDEYGVPEPGNHGLYGALIMVEQAPVWCLRTADADDLPLYSGASFLADGATNTNEAFSTGMSSPDSYVFGDDEVMIIYAKGPGEKGSEIKLLLTHDSLDSEVFIVQVYAPDSDGNYIQVGIDFKCSRKPLKKDGFGKSMYVEDVINSSTNASKYIRVKDNTAISEDILPQEQTSQLQLAGGDDGTEPAAADIANAWDTYFSNRRTVPFTIGIAAGWSDTVVANKLSEIANNRQDCTFILDPVNSTDVPTIVASRNAWSLTSPSYCHAYAPWVVHEDTLNDKIIELPPSCHVAARFLRKNTRGRKWDPLFGKNDFSIMPIKGPVVVFDVGEQQLLTDAFINPIVQEPGVGTYVWGGYTLQSYESFRSWVNIREQMNEDEMAILDFASQYIGKNNNAINRLRATAQLEEYFEPKQGDDNAYVSVTVICNDTNNDNGDTTMHWDIYMTPVAPINNVAIQVTIQRSGQITITELAA